MGRMHVAAQRLLQQQYYIRYLAPSASIHSASLFISFDSLSTFSFHGFFLETSISKLTYYERPTNLLKRSNTEQTYLTAVTIQHKSPGPCKIMYVEGVNGSEKNEKRMWADIFLGYS